MGCDIHLYIEHKNPAYDTWSDFGGRMNPGRHYDMFASMAGVRNRDNRIPVAAPRGHPVDAAWQAKWDNFKYVGDGTEDSVTLERAEEWVKSGSSTWMDDKHTWVTHPDWHTHSWLNADEMEYALKQAMSDNNAEYEAIIAVLRFFESKGHEARVVFWFDN